MAKQARQPRPAYVVCIERGEYRIDLHVGKLYRTARSERNDPPHLLRVIDESGEDYLYPADWFVPIDVPARARRAVPA